MYRCGVKGEGGRAGTALAHPLTTPIPMPGWAWGTYVVCGCCQAGTTARANALTQIVPNSSSLYTLFYSVIYNSVITHKYFSSFAKYEAVWNRSLSFDRFTKLKKIWNRRTAKQCFVSYFRIFSLKFCTSSSSFIPSNFVPFIRVSYLLFKLCIFLRVSYLFILLLPPPLTSPHHTLTTYTHHTHS